MARKKRRTLSGRKPRRRLPLPGRLTGALRGFRLAANEENPKGYVLYRGPRGLAWDPIAEHFRRDRRGRFRRGTFSPPRGYIRGGIKGAVAAGIPLRRIPRRIAANPFGEFADIADNPWVRGYSYFKPSIGRTISVAPYWRRPPLRRAVGIGTNPLDLADIADNPWVGPYSYYKPSIGKVVSVPRYWRRGPVRRGRPAAAANPRRRHRGRTGIICNNPWHENPVIDMPFIENPVLDMPWLENEPDALETAIAPVRRLLDVDFLTGTALPVAGGLFGSRLVAGVASSWLGAIGVRGLESGIGRIASVSLGGIGVGLLSHVLFGGDSRESRSVVLGSSLAILQTILEEVLPGGVKAAIGLKGVGEEEESDLEEAIRERIRDAVEEAVSAEGGATAGTGDYLTHEAFRNAPRLGDYATVEAVQTAEAARQQAAQQAIAQQAVPVGPQPQEVVVDEFADRALI